MSLSRGRKVDGRQVKECERLKEIDKREMELEKRLGEFEKREKEFDAFCDGTSGDLALKEEILEKEKAELVKEVRLANEKINEKQKLGYALIERLELGVKMLGEMKMIMAEKFKELESREEAAHESLTASLNEAELIRERPTEALAFLHLLAVYGISYSFDRSELLRFLKLAEKHKHTPNLCHTLGLADRVPGYIKVLMNEKHFLLASTYIYEYQLQDMFSQSEILNYYASHCKKSANALRRREHNSSAAQEKANAAEIAALRLGIEHIVKHGLESDYSPITYTARIKQLEASQAGLRRRIPSFSANIEKHGRCNGSQETSKWARRKRCREANKSDAFSNPQMTPNRGSNNCSSPDWRQPPQHQSSQMKACHDAPAYPWDFVKLVPFPQSDGPRKRPRANTWVREGGSHIGNVANQC
ncbi:uncharacterized protein LOC121761691 [Salvia splendens]|uniref:uncharacterized protein LOC121761691 n=1 Tax=Salvia splendens TaxID=180675 RepID=UPI001C262041|nr:uncharacterized protein LOC121761691 [Salvia splendens]